LFVKVNKKINVNSSRIDVIVHVHSRKIFLEGFITQDSFEQASSILHKLPTFDIADFSVLESSQLLTNKFVSVLVEGQTVSTTE
jgi:hypothetical protein